MRRDLAHTSITSNAVVLSALISEKVKTLKYFFDEGHYDRIDHDEADRIVELIVTLGKGYDTSGGLEYANFQGLDHILVWIITSRIYSAKVNISRSLSAMRAKISTGPATSAAHTLDKIIRIILTEELKEAEAMNEVIVFMTISSSPLNKQQSLLANEFPLHKS